MSNCLTCKRRGVVVPGSYVMCARSATHFSISWDVARDRTVGCGSYAEDQTPEALPEQATPVMTPPSDWKDTNPKDGIGATKVPLSIVPATAQAYAAVAHHEGRGKYGAWNWRYAGVRASIYLDAAFRHLQSWCNGEECDPATGVPHLGSALACINILIDAKERGKLVDDRPPSTDVAGLLARLAETVQKLNEMHKDRNPRHYTIKDS